MGFPAAVRWRHCSRIRKTRSRKSKRCPIGYCTRLNSVHEHGLCRRERHSYVITHLYILSTNVFTTIWRLFLQPCKSFVCSQPWWCCSRYSNSPLFTLSPFNTGYFDKQSLYCKTNQLFKFKRKQNPPLYFTAIHWNYVFNVHLYVKFNVKQLKCDILKKILTSFWQYYYTCKAQMHYMKRPPFVMLIMNLSVICYLWTFPVRVCPGGQFYCGLVANLRSLAPSEHHGCVRYLFFLFSTSIVWVGTSAAMYSQTNHSARRSAGTSWYCPLSVFEGASLQSVDVDHIGRFWEITWEWAVCFRKPVTPRQGYKAFL